MEEKKPLIYELLYFMPWVAAGFAYRLWRASLQLVMFRDETAYAYQIKHVLAGTIFQDATYYTFPPAYALLAAPVALVTGDVEFSGRLVTCALGAATAIPAFYLARDLFSYRAAVVAAALCALYPTLMSVGLMAESTFGFLLMLGMYLGNRAASSASLKWAALFGLVMAASYLARPEGLFVFFAYLPVAALLLYRSGAGRRLALGLPAVSLAFFMLLAFPYLLQLRSHFGSWEISGKTRINLAKVRAFENLKPGENVDEKLDETYRNFKNDSRGLMGDVAEEMRAIAGRYSRNAKSELAGLAGLAGYPLIAAFALGMFYAFRGDGRLARLGLLSAALVPLALFPMVMVLDRVLMPYIPFAVVFGAFGVASLAQTAAAALGEKAPSYSAHAAALVLAAGVLAGVSGKISLETDRNKILTDILRRDPGYNYNYMLRRYSEKMRPYIEPGAGIICRVNISAYYAGGEYVYLPNTDVEGLVGLAEERGARYLMLGPMEMQSRSKIIDGLIKDNVPLEYPAGAGGPRLMYGTKEFLLYELARHG